jgi:hypothetical protein
MMFFNKQSEIDKIREDIEGVILYFKKDNEMMDDRIKELYRNYNTSSRNLDAKLDREVAYLERKINSIDNDITIFINIGLGLIALVIVILCIIIGYAITH